jgi:hypothetical protein
MGFLAHGLKCAFPPELGAMARGVPTAAAAEPLKSRLLNDDEPPTVWPYAEGEVRGISLAPLYKRRPKRRCGIPGSMASWLSAMQSVARELASETLRSNFWGKRSMPDSNLPMLEDAVSKLTPFSGRDRFRGRRISGLAYYRRGLRSHLRTPDVDVIAEIVT